ncbi:MAG: 7-cyano-7-deazaguanine synthase QueC [Fimbriimonadaceae bacterium]
MPAGCVVLLSGGLDSATTAAVAKRDGFRLHALTVVYGQRHAVEVRAAERVAASLGVVEHRVIHLDLSAFGGSALTDAIEVPKDRDEEAMAAEIPVTYVPARNTVFLSLALAYAEARGLRDIFIGANAVDYSGYPDCRPEFIAQFERLANVATKAGVEGERFRIHAPLIHLPKTEIVRLGLSLGVDYGLTHSCYDPDAEGRPCRRCDACRIRIAAFRELGMEDPALADG